MIKLLITSLFLVGVCFLMYLLHKLVLLTAYPKEMRYFHNRCLVGLFLMLAVLFNTVTFSKILLLVDAVINSEALEDFWSFVLPERRYEVVYLILMILLVNLLVLVLTTLLLAGIKLLFSRKMEIVTVSGMTLVGKLKHVPWVFTEMFYQEREEDGTYQVTDRGFTMHFWAKRMKNGMLLLGGGELIFLLLVVFGDSEALAKMAINFVQGWYLLPMGGYLFLEQIQLFLEGEKEFDAGSYGSETIGERWEGKIEVLPEIYQEEFAGSKALLQSYAGKEMEIVRDGLAFNGLNHAQLDGCEQPEILFLLSNQLKEAGIVQSIAFQNALVALLNGTSINVRDEIQGEFLSYLAVYMNFFVSQEKTFLLLCESKKKAEQIREALEKSLGKINKIHSIWKTADIDMADSNEEMHILVCSYDDFVQHRLVDKRNDFFRTLFTVVLTDVMNFSAQGNVQKELVFTEFEKVRQNLQYVIISQEDNVSLRTAFEYYINEEIISYKNDSMKPNLHVMVWKEESSHKIQRCLGIGDAQSSYLGVSIPLALVGAKYDLPVISVFSNEKKGYQTYNEVMKMEHQEVARYLGWEMDLDKIIRFDPFSMTESNEIDMFILYDANCNFYSMLWAWMKYGGRQGTMIHIVSPPYLLREYFADNLERLIVRNNDFAPLISYQSSLKYSCFLEILIDLGNAGLYEEQLEKKNKEYKWGYKNVTELLSDCLCHVLREQEFYNIYECFRFEEQSVFDPSSDRFEKRTLVRLIDENIRRRIQEQMAFAQVVTKNNKQESIPILKQNISNYFLKGQVVPLGGYMQRIVNINDGMVFAEQVVTTDKKEYCQCSEFSFSDLKLIDECVDQDIVDFNLYTGQANRRIYGYWECNDQLNLEKENAAKLNKICDGQGNPLEVTMNHVHVLEIRMKRSCFGGKSEEAVFLAAFLFQEIFRTIFPANHQNLFTAVEYDPSEDYWDNMLGKTGQMSLEEKLHSIVPFFRGAGNDPDYVRFYVTEFSGLEMGMVTSLYGNRNRVFQIVQSYLNWYLGKEPGQGSVKPEYLHFGGEQIPSCFAAENLADFCQKILPVYETQHSNASHPKKIRANHTCTFCGKPVLFTCKMDDERRMCRSCKQQQISQKDEIKGLYKETVDFLCKTYHIKLRKNIHLRLQSADSIRKRCQISGAGRVLGFYQPGNHELWIEARGPRNAVQDTMIHELSHAWQFDNVNVTKLKRKYKEKDKLFLEGHASYMEVDAMRKLGEGEYADHLEEILMMRDDEYGEGYRMLKDYLEAEEKKGSHHTPYEALKELIDQM